MTAHPLSTRPPAYCCHKATNQAYVRLQGGRGPCTYLGVYDSPESRRAYQELVQTWLRRRRRSAAVGSSVYLVGQLIADYIDHSDPRVGHSQRCRIRAALSELAETDALTPAHDLCARDVKRLQVAMARRGCSRSTVNAYTYIIRSMVSWGVAEGMLAPEVLTSVKSVPGLRPGSGVARDKPRVASAPLEVIDATRPFLSETVRAMVDVQLLTGMRAGELVRMTPAEIDTTGEVWLYQPAEHKTAHHGIDRVAPIGPRCQAIIAPRMHGDRSLPIFRNSRGQPFTVGNYRNRIAAAVRCRAPLCLTDDARARWIAERTWTPHQLRHTRATEIRRVYGLESAGAVLGHAQLEVTQVYAERDAALARRVALETG